MLEEDRPAICGPRYQHQADRQASRTVQSEVVLGGRKVALRRPRVRASEAEVPLPTFQLMASEDPLNRRVVEQMLVGVATRQYARSLEPLPSTMTTRGVSKSAVSRRFVAKTAAQLDAWRSTALDALDLVALLIDGSTSASTASSWPSASITPAANTRWASGMDPRRMPPCARA
jgi:putative transposase